MCQPSKAFCGMAVLLMLCASGCVRRAPTGAVLPPSAPEPKPSIVQATLTAPSSLPFHLKAVITERADPNERAEVEIYWMSPEKWRRTIHSEDFSQTLIVNGNKGFEQDSEDYFPLPLRTLVTAMVDPKPVLDAVRPGDLMRTKANGASEESGKVYFRLNAKRPLVLMSPYGLTESVGGPGHRMDFMDYRELAGKRVAWRLVYHIDAGDSLLGQITQLEELKSPEEGLFLIAEPTPKEEQIQSAILSEAELRSLSLQPMEIIWPQVLDGATSGQTSYYVSVDRTGQVREVFPVSVAIERADDSARRQILRWKFAPVLRDGVPVQAEGLLNFNFNTRAYGPAVPLTNEEVRKLASSIVEPEFPPGTAPGTTYSLWIAVDSDGYVIEVLAGDGPPKLFGPCLDAIRKSHFNSILVDGKPRPYRAQVTFRAP